MTSNQKFGQKIVNNGELDYKYTEFSKLINPAKENIKSEKIGMALFGIGRAGTIHLKNLIENPRVELLYVVETRQQRINEIQNLVGLPASVFVTTDKTSAVLKDPRVQAVVIATPTDSHQPLVLESLQAGKKVFCEKPIANDVQNVKLCYATAEKLGLPLLCAFNRRFDPTFVSVKNRIDPTFVSVKNRIGSGEIGPIHVVKTTARDSPTPTLDYLKISNGIFHDCAVHDIDLVCWMLNEFPVEVYATAIAHDPAIKAINDHDTVVINMTFASGAFGVIDLSRHGTYGYDQRLEVFGLNGMMTCPNQPTLGVETFTAKSVSKPTIWFSFPSRYEDAYKLELDHFLNVVQGKEDIKVSGAETVAICNIALACEESVRTGLPVVLK